MGTQVTENIREVKKAVRSAQHRTPPSDRPKTRGECANVPRPCPYVSCRYNLFLDIKENGSVRYAYSSDVRDIAREADTCALDVAARGPHSYDELKDILKTTFEWAFQMEQASLRSLRKVLEQDMTDLDGVKIGD